LVGPPIEPSPVSIRQYYHDWLDKDGYPVWSFWENVKSWWAIRHLPNVRLIHFAQLKADMPGQMRQIAAFPGIPIEESRWEAMLEHCSFAYMKQHATKSVPLGGAFWDGGAQTFINQGTNGRWREILTQEESEKYEHLTLEKLGSPCAHWLATGEVGV
jgi:aryl sulfotransferase